MLLNCACRDCKLDGGIIVTEDARPTFEISIDQGHYKVVVRAESWREVISQVRVAEMKMRIANQTCFETSYDFTHNRWSIAIPKRVGIVRTRIAMALLLVFPERISRDDLSLLSSVQMGSLNNYLTKPELDVQPHIDENEAGLILNVPGFKWAIEILKSLEGQYGSQEEEDDDRETE